MKKNWMYGSVMTALLALMVSGCGDSQRTLEFRGMSLAQSYFYLTYLIGEKLSEENFQTMQTYFDELQKLGKKAVLRFAYERDFMGRAAVGPTGEQILEHLDQLKPFLEKNKDLILVVQAGMIGAWGEWHSSIQGLENSEETKAAVLEKLLSVVPVERNVQVRLPEFKNLLKFGGRR